MTRGADAKLRSIAGARPFARIAVPAMLALSSACRGSHSALDPAGPHAGAISNLWWIFFAVCMTVYLLVVAALLIATFRRDRDQAPSPRKLTLAVGVAGGLTVLTLFALLVASSLTGSALERLGGAGPPLRVRVTAQQWWWSVEYVDAIPSRHFTTANEITVPIGRPVELMLHSKDVIHSFWVPNLHGKRDVMPGHRTAYTIRVDRPGTWEGQCAEFCGAQHAKMRLLLTALPPEEFERWADTQRQPAAAPRTLAEMRGQQVFLSGSCPLCHTIQGTEAHSRVGPDLTHVAGRKTLASGSLPNTTGHLAGWILDPQRVKPGSHMPANPLSSDDLNALLAYLGTLK